MTTLPEPTYPGNLEMQIRAKGGKVRDSQIVVPGDKSVSHRGVILGSIANGMTTVNGCLLGADVRSTIQCFQRMGASIEIEGNLVTIEGVGKRGLSRPLEPLDAGNAGTCMRLVSGVLAGQPFTSTFIGDHSLSRRPMRRIIEPLQLMGATIEATPQGTAPLTITGKAPLDPIEYVLPVASAQIKSAILLAALYASGPCKVVEPERVRDHTERMLGAFGTKVSRDGDEIIVHPGQLAATRIEVPGDISSAAFFIVAGLLSRDSQICIRNVGLNLLRTGVVDILQMMGGRIEISNRRLIGGEELGDITAFASDLIGIDVPQEHVSRAIDEFPIIFVAAAFAKGITRVTGAAELRVKESDRIALMVNGLNAIGASAEATPDGAIITGRDSAQGGVVIETAFDHRIAMSFAIASLRCRAPLTVLDADSIATSFPGFPTLCAEIGMELEHGNT